MKGMIGLLARAGLVELSEEEIAQRGKDSGSQGRADSAAREMLATVTPALDPAGTVAEGQPFEEIYAQANLAPSPFPAERLVKLLDGLKALDPATRKAAVVAMDAADDNWTITDPVGDAQHKVSVLESYKARLAAHVAAGEQHATDTINQLRAEQDTNAGEIRRQIADLEALLERETASTARKIEATEGELRATREAALREERRANAEIERLREVIGQFASTST